MKNIFPNIVSFITQHPRSIVTEGIDFEWSENLWVHNIFRMYELICGRRDGIRIETKSYINEYGNEIHEFYSFEAMCAFGETYVRNMLKRIPRFKVVKVYIPVFSFAGVPNFRAEQPYLFSIALDATSVPTSTAGSSPKGISITTAGSNRMLIASTYYNPGAAEVSTVTYNSVAMTSIVSNMAPNGILGTLFMLQAPTVGTNNALGTSTNTSRPLSLGVVSYTGVSQTVTADSFASTTGTASTINQTTTVVAASCWLVCGIMNQVSDTAGTGATQRTNGSSSSIRNSIYDSNGTVGTGSQGMTINFTSGGFVSVILSMAPAAGTTTNPAFLLNFI